MRSLLALFTSVATLAALPAWADAPNGHAYGTYDHGRDDHGRDDRDDHGRDDHGRDDHGRDDRDHDRDDHDRSYGDHDHDWHDAGSHGRPSTPSVPSRPYPTYYDHTRPGSAWDVGPRGVPPGVVDLRNDAGVAVDLYVDGVLRGAVPPGADLPVPASAGLHAVVARARFDGRVLLDQRVALSPGRPTVVQLAPRSWLTLTNRDRRTVRVWIAGREAATVRPGTSVRIEVAVGRQRVVVAEDQGRVLYDAPAWFTTLGSYDVAFDHGMHVDARRPLM